MNIILYRINQATSAEIETHFRSCDFEFISNLNKKITISSYIQKIMNNAMRFEAWFDAKLIGLIAIYSNDPTCQRAYITNVSVLPSYQGLGIGSELLKNSINYVTSKNFSTLELEVQKNNTAAISVYSKNGFKINNTSQESIFMTNLLKKEF